MNSKIEARIESVRLAINVEGVTSENIVEVSKAIYEFVIGDAELPESHDSNAEIKELMTKAFANNSSIKPEMAALHVESDKFTTEDKKAEDDETTEKA